MRTILVIIALIVFLNIFFRSKKFKVWRLGRNKTAEQKRAIKFLIYGPSRSKISKEEYDSLCYEMHSDEELLNKAKEKLGISDSDIVTHPCEEIDSTHLSIRNYVRDGEKVLVLDLDMNEFRSSRMECFMVIFGKKKLYFYKMSYRADMTEETYTAYEYSYDEIRQFYVTKVSNRNDTITTSFSLQREISEEDAKDRQKMNDSWIKFPPMAMSREAFKKWDAIGPHLDSIELKKEYKKKTENEKIALRYFKAYYNLPLAPSDSDYEALVAETLSADKLKAEGMRNMGIEEADIQFAAPIAFRSYIYGENTLEIKGIDGNWRSNIPQHTWIFFGKYQIFLFSESMEINTTFKKQSTQEIFYRDISSILTDRSSTEKVEGDFVYRISFFEVTILFSGDNKISLTLPILSDDNQNKILAMRNLLREVKQNSLHYSAKEDLV